MTDEEEWKRLESYIDPRVPDWEQPLSGLPVGTKYTGDPYKQKYVQPKVKYIDISTPSLTPNAVQVKWKVPSEFPCCPQNVSENPLQEYKQNLKGGAVFCRNDNYSSTVVDSAFDKNGVLWIMTKNPENFKPWALAYINYENGRFVHVSHCTYFEERGARKDFALVQGKDWTGGDVVDDNC